MGGAGKRAGRIRRARTRRSERLPSVVPPRSPSTVDDAYAAALALIPVNPSVRAAAQAR